MVGDGVRDLCRIGLGQISEYHHRQSVVHVTSDVRLKPLPGAAMFNQ